MSGAVEAAAPRLAAIDEHVDGWLRRRAGRGARDRALADALRIVAASTRSGDTLPRALERVAERRADEVGRACGAAAARMALGLPVVDEVERLAARLHTPAARLFAQVVRVQHRRGGDLGEPCRRLAALLHERLRLDAEARAATAQARFSARAVIAIPLLLAAGVAWRSPELARATLRPDVLLLATPGIALVAAGAIVAARVARSAVDVGVHGVAVGRDPWLRRSLGRLAGHGTLSARSVRLALGSSVVAAVVVAARPSVATIACAVATVAAALAWPWSDRARLRRQHERTAQAGIESLLEVSVALLAAGATAHEVATLAPAAADEPLRSALAPAVHHVGLGRSLASAYAPIPEVAVSPQLDGWLHALGATAEFGSPAGPVLEQLLRDARSHRREQLRAIAQTAAPRMQLALVLLVVPGIMWLMLLATVGGLVGQLRSAGVA